MNFLFVGALSGLLSVAIGAFGAHALKSSLSGYSLSIFETANQYQFYHSLALILVAILARLQPSTKLMWSGRFFLLGTLVFSGSLYLLGLTGVRWLGAITPIGGVCLLLGWGLLARVGIDIHK